MLEILQFVFSGFWAWLGILILIGILGASIGSAILAVRGM